MAKLKMKGFGGGGAFTTSHNPEFPPECKGLYPPDHFVWLDDQRGTTPIMRLSDGAFSAVETGVVVAKAPCGLRRYVLRQREDGMFEETGEEITLDTYRAELDGHTPDDVSNSDLSGRAILEKYVFDQTVESHAPHNHWNFTWPHLQTELGDTPETRAKVKASIEAMMAPYPNDFKIVGLQRRYLLYFADSSPSKQQMYVGVVEAPTHTTPFTVTGLLKEAYVKDYTPHDYAAKKPCPGGGQPLVYRGVAWVVRFLLDGQSPAFHGCRVYVGEGDHPGFTDHLLPVGQFYCSDWCQRHDFSTYGRGINLQFADFTFDGWTMGACLPYAMSAGEYTPPPKLKVVSQDVRTLVEKHKNHRIPDLAEIMKELREGRPSIDVALGDLMGDIEDAESATNAIVRAVLADFKAGQVRKLIGMPVIISPSLPLSKPLSQYPEVAPLIDEAGLAHLQLGDHRECQLLGGHPLLLKAGKTPEERFKSCPVGAGCINIGALHMHPSHEHIIPDIPALRKMVRSIVDARVDVEKRARDKIDKLVEQAETLSDSSDNMELALPFGEAGADAIPAPGLDADVIALAEKLAAESAAKFFPPMPGEEGYVPPVAPEPHSGSHGESGESYPPYVQVGDDGTLRLMEGAWYQTNPETVDSYNYVDQYPTLQERMGQAYRDECDGIVASCAACQARIHLDSGAMLQNNACFFAQKKHECCLGVAVGTGVERVKNAGEVVRAEYLEYQESLGVMPGGKIEGLVPLQKIGYVPGVAEYGNGPHGHDNNVDVDPEDVGKGDEAEDGYGKFPAGWTGSGWMYDKLKNVGFKYVPESESITLNGGQAALCKDPVCLICPGVLKQHLPNALQHLLDEGLTAIHVINTMKHWYGIKEAPNLPVPAAVEQPLDPVWQPSAEDIDVGLDGLVDDDVLDAPSPFDAPL